MGKFVDFIPPTKIAYREGRPTELHLRRCIFGRQEGSRRKERVFDQAMVSIGAMDDNDLVLNEDTVSRYHCKVVQEEEGYLLTDLGSTNGTYINGVRIREAYLQEGCALRLGNLEMVFSYDDEKLPIVPSQDDRLGKLIGRNVKMREIYGIIEKIAPTGTTVIIEGETGTGKEVVAQCIHNLSSRSSGPMMVFDCGAVPENLIESELFGHEKGSFTGAIMTRKGIFEMAHGGTLFLDELGELSLDLQPKLLRVLEQREIRRVGTSKSIRVDVRLIAATNRHLEEEVRAGRFRQDLFYRLSVVRIMIPPLRERPEDIPLLAQHFLDTGPFNRTPGGGLRASSISPEALNLLSGYKWPGNVRELLNVIERAVSFAEGPRIETKDLPDQLHPSQPQREREVEAFPESGIAFKEAKGKWVSSFERDYLIKLLARNKGNISHAAKEAEIDRKYFRKLMRKHGITADMIEVKEPG